MKQVFGVVLAFFLIMGCKEPQSPRYTQNSAEIEIIRDWIAAYNLGDWEAMRSVYADTAKIWHNALEPASVAELMLGLEETVNSCSSYNLGGPNQDFEMVITDENETWVNYWGRWEGIMNSTGTKVTMPVHVTSRLVDGKIVAEHAYYDMGNLGKALAEIPSSKPDSLLLEQDKE